MIFTVTGQTPLTDTVYRLELAGDTAAITRPGQFVQIKVPGFYLRRPISVCDWGESGLTLIYKVVGQGTRAMTGLVSGAELDLLTGLGNGFDPAACEVAGADGLSRINTQLGMRIDLARRRPVLANVMGGYSGPGVFPVALRMVYQVTGAVKIPVVGMGGVSSARDVIEMMMAGTTAVEVGAANLVDPYACKRIIEELPQVMAELGIRDLKEIQRV